MDLYRSIVNDADLQFTSGNTEIYVSKELTIINSVSLSIIYSG